MTTSLAEETKPVDTGNRPVHYPTVEDEFLALCGADLTRAQWSTRSVECEECLVLSELYNIGGSASNDE